MERAAPMPLAYHIRTAQSLQDQRPVSYTHLDVYKRQIVYNPKSFTDLGNHAWADDAITRLAARGIINGITATTYGPARNITRADFTTLIVRAFGFEGEAASFADVSANAYYAETVGIAKTLGIVGGVNESDFAPTAEITRQDMMVIVARALDVYKRQKLYC